MRNVFFVATGLMVLGALAMACVPCPEPGEQTPAPCTVGCCAEAEKGGIVLEYKNLPFPTGTLPPVFTFKGVGFTRIWDEIRFDGNSLFCNSAVESPPGTWNDAAVRLDFGSLSCAVCSIVADCAGHGPEARLEAQMLGGGTQTAICPGQIGTVTLTTSVDAGFVSAVLSGQEAEWLVMRLE